MAVKDIECKSSKIQIDRNDFSLFKVTDFPAAEPTKVSRLSTKCLCSLA